MNSTIDTKPQMQAMIAIPVHAPPSVLATSTHTATQNAAAQICPSQFSTRMRVLL